jgi:hypothetical protein
VEPVAALHLRLPQPLVMLPSFICAILGITITAGHEHRSKSQHTIRGIAFAAPSSLPHAPSLLDGAHVWSGHLAVQPSTSVPPSSSSSSSSLTPTTSDTCRHGADDGLYWSTYGGPLQRASVPQEALGLLVDVLGFEHIRGVAHYQNW